MPRSMGLRSIAVGTGHVKDNLCLAIFLSQSVVFDQKCELFYSSKFAFRPQQCEISRALCKTELGGFEEVINSWGGLPNE
jgi:hypothetical protein